MRHDWLWFVRNILVFFALLVGTKIAAQQPLPPIPVPTCEDLFKVEESFNEKYVGVISDDWPSIPVDVCGAKLRIKTFSHIPIYFIHKTSNELRPFFDLFILSELKQREHLLDQRVLSRRERRIQERTERKVAKEDLAELTKFHKKQDKSQDR